MAQNRPASDAVLVAAARAGDMAAFARQEDHEEVPVMTTEAEPARTGWVEVDVIDICRSDRPDDPLLRPHVVVLRERGGTRRLPIHIGPAEAVALACSLEAVEMPRPMTHQLTASLLAATGSRLGEVRITRLVDGVFYAVAVVQAPGGTVEVDARPSDALNLAAVTGAPVRVDAAVLGDPAVDCHPEWEQYPARLPDLAEEERRRRAEMLAQFPRK